MVTQRIQSKQECLILVTGAAGTGKSTVLEETCRIAKNEGFEPIRLAPSGVAAVNIKGQTLHRWFKLTMSGRQSEGNSYAIREQLMDITDQGLSPIFMIDEASMISGDILNILSKALQEAVNTEIGVPFGGIPVILFGDFGQLGPVNKSFARTDWIWNSEIYRWFERVDLIQPCRQSGDVEFKSLLDDIRCSMITSATVSMFLDICNLPSDIPEDALHLYPFKRDVDRFNLNKLQNLPGEEWYSIAYDNARITKNEDRRRAIESETGLASVLWLKVGARVMCTSNVDVAGGVVNGATGIVVRFYDQHVVQVREDNTGRIFNIQQECRRTKFNGQERRQFPLVLAWALTIHKCQSLTLNKVAVNLRDVFASGQAYVALRRVRTSNDLFIKNWSAKGLLSVKHAVITRLTKDSEASRTKEDEEMDKQEELDSEAGGGEVSNMRQHELRLQGWEDYTNSVLDLLYGSGQAIPTSGNRSLFQRSSTVDLESGGEQSVNDYTWWEEKEDKVEQHDESGLFLSIDEKNTPEFEEANGCSSGGRQSTNDNNLLDQQENDRFTFREDKKRYYDSDSLGSDSIECDSTGSEVGAVIVSKRNKGKRRRVEHGSYSDFLDPDIVAGWESDSDDDSSDSKDDGDSGDSSNEVDGSNRERAYCDEDVEAELRKKMRFCMDQE